MEIVQFMYMVLMNLCIVYSNLLR